MNLSELKKKHAEMGKEIERLEKEREPLTWNDVKVGQPYRANGGTLRRMKTGDRSFVTIANNGIMDYHGRSDDIYVVLQDSRGNDLPPEKQVRP